MPRPMSPIEIRATVARGGVMAGQECKQCKHLVQSITIHDFSFLFRRFPLLLRISSTLYCPIV